MTFKELKQKTTGELHGLLAEKRDHLRELRFKDANKQLKTVREIRINRQEIAWILTLLNVEPVVVEKVEVKEEKVVAKKKEAVKKTVKKTEAKEVKKENK